MTGKQRKETLNVVKWLLPFAFHMPSPKRIEPSHLPTRRTFLPSVRPSRRHDCTSVRGLRKGGKSTSKCTHIAHIHTNTVVNRNNKQLPKRFWLPQSLLHQEVIFSGLIPFSEEEETTNPTLFQYILWGTKESGSFSGDTTRALYRVLFFLPFYLYPSL